MSNSRHSWGINGKKRVVEHHSLTSKGVRAEINVSDLKSYRKVLLW